MICLEMYGNGAGIGLKMVRCPQGLSVCKEEAAGLGRNIVASLLTDIVSRPVAKAPTKGLGFVALYKSFCETPCSNRFKVLTVVILVEIF